MKKECLLPTSVGIHEGLGALTWNDREGDLPEDTTQRMNTNGNKSEFFVTEIETATASPTDSA
jgi:hypothetical protein